MYIINAIVCFLAAGAILIAGCTVLHVRVGDVEATYTYAFTDKTFDRIKDRRLKT